MRPTFVEAPPTSTTRLLWRATLAAVALFLAHWPDDAAARRVALVIGNSAYQTIEPLPNASRDARLIGQTLLQVGFDQVDIRTDLDRERLRRAIELFGAAAESADSAVLYYAGHAVEVNGQSWILPIDALVTQESQVPVQGIAMGDMLAELGRARGVRILVLDACRNNRFAERWPQAERDALGRRLVLRGLGEINVEDTLVLYSAKAGTAALDGAAGANSPFAVALSDRMTNPGVEVRRLFGLVREDVLHVTNGRQEPMTYGTIAGPAAYFVPPNAATMFTDADGQAWQRARSLDTEQAYADYLQHIPNGRHWSNAAVHHAERVAERVRSGPSGFAGRVIVVAPDGRGSYRTLQDAIAAALDGDRIQLRSGSYRVPPLRISRSILIQGPPLGQAPAVLLSDASRQNHEAAILIPVEGGAPWIERVTVRCSCPSIHAYGGQLTLRQTSGGEISVSSQGAATLIDNTLSSIAPHSDVIAVGNTLSQPIAIRSDGRTVFFRNTLTVGGPSAPSFDAPSAASFHGAGWALLQENRIDARRLVHQPFSRATLLYLRGGSGYLAVIGNTIITPPAWQPSDWYQCVDVVACNVVIADNIIEPTGPARPSIALDSIDDWLHERATTPGTAIAAAEEGGRILSRVFRDTLVDGGVCDFCPAMVVIPSGAYLMGSPQSERGSSADEGPQHHVAVGSFAVGVFEVTFDQWDVCVSRGGCAGHQPDSDGWGAGTKPVPVSWAYAQLYLAWLSRETGQRYRLLNEAEWEYAARAGTTGRYYNNGDEAGLCQIANHADSSSSIERRNLDCSDGVADRAADVGSYAPNAFGIYDTLGNVSEWVEDCYSPTYARADPSPASSCSNRVSRGGAWNLSARYARSAARSIYGTGFRVARDLRATLAVEHRSPDATAIHEDQVAQALNPPPSAAVPPTGPSGWLGVRVEWASEQETRVAGAPATAGALITAVAPSGPAELAGLQAGDIIDSLNATVIEGPRDLTERIGSLVSGQRIVLGIWRNAQHSNYSVELTQRPAQPQPAP